MPDRLVVDNSVVMAWCFADEANSYVDSVLDYLLNSEAIVPAIWPLEVGNVLVVAERNKRLSEADSIRFITLLNSLPIRIEAESRGRQFSEIFSLAREMSLSTYDASYLDLAMRLGLSLATQDKMLRTAAIKCQVPLYS